MTILCRGSASNSSSSKYFNSALFVEDFFVNLSCFFTLYRLTAVLHCCVHPQILLCRFFIMNFTCILVEPYSYQIKCTILKIVNKVSQRSLHTNERSIWYGLRGRLVPSDVIFQYLWTEQRRVQ